MGEGWSSDDIFEIGFADEKDRVRGVEGDEAGKVEVFGGTGEELGVAIVEDLGETEAVGLGGEVIDGIAGESAGGDGDGSGFAEGNDVDAVGVRMVADFAVLQEGGEGEEIVGALGEEGGIVAVGVASELARVVDDRSLLRRLRLEAEVGTEDDVALVEQGLDGGFEFAIGLAKGIAAVVVEPEDDSLAALFGVEPGGRNGFVMGGVGEAALHFEMGGMFGFFFEAPGDFTGLGVGAADHHFEGGGDDLFEGLGVLELFLGVVIEPAEEGAFEVGAVGFGGGVLGIPDGELLAGERFEIGFDDGGFEAEFEVVIEKGVKRGAADGVVGVGKDFASLEEEVILGGVVELVEFLKLREAFGGHFFRPVVGAVHALGFGGEEGSEFDVAGVDAKKGGVFTGAAALHGGADHDDGEGKLDAVVDGGEKHGLGAASAGSGDGGAGGVDLGKGEKEVEAADGVPGLDAHDVLEVGFGLRTVEAPVFDGVHLGALFGEFVDNFFGELLGVGVAEHVPLPDDAAHGGELVAEGLKGALSAAGEAFGADGDVFADGEFGFEIESGVFTVAVGEEDAGDFASGIFGSVEIASDEESGGTLEVDFFNGVGAAVDGAVDDGVERGFGG